MMKNQTYWENVVNWELKYANAGKLVRLFTTSGILDGKLEYASDITVILSVSNKKDDDIFDTIVIPREKITAYAFKRGDTK